MKKLVFILLSLSLIGCATTHRLELGDDAKPLENNEGYLGLVFNTLDPLKNIQFKNKDTGKEFYEGRIDKGTHQITLKVPTGEYCLVGFDVYNWRVDYTQQGFCTYVEADEVNYFGEFVVRDPVTVINSNFSRYLLLLAKEHPNICTQFIGEGC